MMDYQRGWRNVSWIFIFGKGEYYSLNIDFSSIDIELGTFYIYLNLFLLTFHSQKVIQHGDDFYQINLMNENTTNESSFFIVRMKYFGKLNLINKIVSTY